MITFTKEALEIMSRPQQNRIREIAGWVGVTEVKCMIDFSLPTGYIYVIITGKTTIHGGIDKEGVMST